MAASDRRLAAGDRWLEVATGHRPLVAGGGLLVAGCGRGGVPSGMWISGENRFR
ncbi:MULTISPECIES: hypothetical protein [Actinosynnema]|uniref:hypothetical protein n=1 Tax=Actinosynnema TaxID=40566 RepID=UPI0020A23F1E|nr:hypothetical protein [Actinosynnema pretiosum]